MTAQIIRAGPWQQAVKALEVLCADGKRRTARITGEPDTFFSIPARISYKGKTITGFLTATDVSGVEGDLQFIAYSYRKNGQLLERTATDGHPSAAVRE